MPRLARADVHCPPLTFPDSRGFAGPFWGYLGLSELEFDRGVSRLRAHFDSAPGHFPQTFGSVRGRSETRDLLVSSSASALDWHPQTFASVRLQPGRFGGTFGGHLRRSKAGTPKRGCRNDGAEDEHGMKSRKRDLHSELTEGFDALASVPAGEPCVPMLRE